MTTALPCTTLETAPDCIETLLLEACLALDAGCADLALEEALKAVAKSPAATQAQRTQALYLLCRCP